MIDATDYPVLARLGIRITRVANPDEPPGVPDSEMRRVLSPAMYAKWQRWIDGQTCCMQGAYPDDVERFLLGLPVID